MPRPPTPAPDRRIARRGLRDHVYERILELLLSGELEPGARLAIDTIARELAVSPTPVREALVHLERTGLVTREALKGYRVAPPLSEGELAEVFEARLMLETTAARLATPASGVMLEQLREAQQRHVRAGERVAEALAAGRVDLTLTTEYFASDSDFHAVVLEHCGNRYLLSMSVSLGAQLHRMRQSALRGVTDVHEAVAEHAAVVDAFSSRTTARGEVLSPEQAMRRHIENVRERSLRIAREL
ncbi:GntR family transcriptional regulator [Auraticoccus monumenti]|uniref:DNA-binding transcriptional regulator, GntR family n=1 Tax=Auraticoccus monumenti TaxID=675864 RepID=A0A1G6UG67_9ACTN|nr:GntR family transcriptional regulator [Auraticoccus monumenti]SDD39706.1 DNA-binding transcriptional regulator, GntR family [Auraticoccus monumenti]